MSDPLASLTSGALSEIAAQGAQDALLSCQPEESLWVQSYARITNFAVAEQDVCPSNSISGPWSAVSCASVEVPRAGDLLADAYFVARLSAIGQPTNANEHSIWTPAVGMALLKSVKLSIGGQLFEEITDTYQMMYDEIHRPEGKRMGLQAGDYGRYLRGVRNHDNTSTIISLDRDEDTFQAALTYSTREQDLNVRLPLHFTHSTGNALNIVGLQYHQVNIEMALRGRDELAMTVQSTRSSGALVPITLDIPSGGEIQGAKIRLVFVHLDTPERRVQAQQPRTVMFTYPQNQEISHTSGTSLEARNYHNHPVTEFLWAFRQEEAVQGDRREYFRFGALSGAVVAMNGGADAEREVVDAIVSVEVKLNNHPRICGRSAYFHEAVPQARSARKPSRMVSQYAFAVEPSDKSRNTGSLNLSRIDNVVLSATLRSVAATREGIDGSIAGKLFLHASTINFYRIAGGMAGLMFAN